MKKYKIISFILMVLVLGCTNVMASTIPCSFSEYEANAKVWSIYTPSSEDYDVQPCPPVDAFASFNSDAWAQALDNNISASSDCRLGFTGSSFLQVTYAFTSTFPSILIEYDYMVSAGAWNTDGYGISCINSSLTDLNLGITVWSDYLNVSVSYSMERDYLLFGGGKNEVVFGSIDEVVPLVLSHDYELSLVSYSEAWGEMFHGYGGASAAITNFSITAVPIPGGFVLMASGLLGLLRFQRKISFKRE